MTTNHERFATSGEFVAGTLRGYRSWRLMPHSPQVSMFKKEVVWKNQMIDVRGLGEPEPDYVTVPSFIGYREPDPEYVLAAVSYETFWSRAKITADVCFQDPFWIPFNNASYRNQMPAMSSREIAWVANRRPIHQIPTRSCTCGIYGWYTPEWALLEHTAEIMGVIEVTGKVLLGTSGFRAEKAEIKAITVNERFATPAVYRNVMTMMGGERYQGIELIPNPEKLVNAYPPDLDTLKNLGITPDDAPDGTDGMYASGGIVSGAQLYAYVLGRVTTAHTYGAEQWMRETVPSFLEFGGEE